MNIEPKLQAIEQEYNDVGKKLEDPEIISNPKELQILGKKRAQLEPVVIKYQEYKDALKAIAEAKELIKSGDSELEELAREELATLEPRIESFTHDLTLLLLPQDPNDDKSV
ncbi:MAG: PCRF domain-containing protein, partial [Synergistaceae bacterium]|nr:PCRF domain-containing protein [Synergistaceae bacterium]